MSDLSWDERWEQALLDSGEMLLNGWGYNWYRTETSLRADDVLLRNHAEALLGEAEASLRRAEAKFRTAHLPPPSREHPVPNAARLAELRAFQAFLAELGALRTSLRGAAMPTDDKLWRRNRDERALLARLGRCDSLLAGAGDALRLAAADDGAASLTGQASSLQAHIERLRALLDERREILSVAWR